MIKRCLGPRKELLLDHPAGDGLKRTLGWPHLIALGVGAIVGTGIYTLTGVGAERAGPAVILAFAIAGAVCACAALCYAELATLIPSSGSAYTYCYTALGRNIAWIVGWSLILEYSVSLGAVAVGWSGYLVGWIGSSGIVLPHALVAGPHDGGIINIPAIIVVFAIAGLLIAGTRESAWVNMILVAIKLSALSAFVLLALPAFNADNLSPFMPYGFASTYDSAAGETRGVMAAAAIVFFAFYGFDAVATSAEETKNPARDVKIGIIGSMLMCTLIYMLVSVAAIGAVDHLQLAGSSEPLAFVLRTLDHPVIAWLIGLAAIIALPSVILVLMFGQTRIFFAMSRDGLLPARLAAISPRTGTPVLVTLATATFVALIAGFLPLAEIAELANAGTLLAFIAVAVAMIALRHLAPDVPRVFRCPLPYLVGPLAIVGCLYLLVSLPTATLTRFLLWNVIGILLFAIMEFARRRRPRVTA